MTNTLDSDTLISMKNNIKMSYQSYGSSILLFLCGDTEKDAYNKWLSLANWGATSLLEGEEPEFVAENTISCWSTMERLESYLLNINLQKLLREDAARFKGIPGGALAEAQKLAEQDFNAIERDTYRSVNSIPAEYELGTITAEKEDLDFKDQCYKAAYSAA